MRVLPRVPVLRGTVGLIDSFLVEYSPIERRLGTVLFLLGSDRQKTHTKEPGHTRY